MKKHPVCSISGCDELAYCEVLLYDFYAEIEEAFMEQDHTCPFLCREHMVKNELSCKGNREPSGDCSYLFTNKEGARGFSIYKPLSDDNGK